MLWHISDRVCLSMQVFFYVLIYRGVFVDPRVRLETLH
ncbi:hypothetical protein Ga0080574_TMP5102 (plasmid) [Salipiger abyssi]|uniref:Uncharacterized protein n=1 Tax=Salipiger abyssi TaxID=1250539 RepID=A0A1P8V150_9RHOB|nr:hypothetical protein Ga0080574_TMP5102 [Salipiger abyssi]